MPEAIRGHLPIRPHLLRYVAWRESLASESQPLRIPGPSLVATMLGILLVNKTQLLLSPAERATALAHCTARLHYTVQGRGYWRQQIFVPDEAALALGNFLNTLLHGDLLDRIQAGQREGVLEKTVIERFLIDTDLDDLIEFDALKKAQYRYRKALGYHHHRGNQPAGYVHRRR